MKFKNLVGQIFGRLLVIGIAPKKGRRTAFFCQCQCGTKITALSEYLVAGWTRSCGCLADEARRYGKHGHARKGKRHELYVVWSSMKDRCLNPKSSNWHLYGGRGITVCDRWKNDFAAFLQDMGERPDPKLSIERIDNNKGYSPDNCKWATISEQMLNRRPMKRRSKYMIEGLSAAEWATLHGKCPSTIIRRMKKGISGSNLLKDQRDGSWLHRRKGIPRPGLVKDGTGKFIGYDHRKRMNGFVETR